MNRPPDKPTDEEVEAQLEAVGKAAIQKLRETHRMRRGLSGFLFPGGHPGPVAERWFRCMVNYTRRDD